MTLQRELHPLRRFGMRVPFAARNRQNLNLTALSRFVFLTISYVLVLFLLKSSVVHSQVPSSSGYSIIRGDANGLSVAGLALSSFNNESGVLLWQAGVGAIEPMQWGRFLVDEDSTKTGFLLVNASDDIAY